MSRIRAVRVTSKSAFIHTLASRFKVNVEFLDRRWWEFRPRMQVTIPVVDDHDVLNIQGKVLREIHLYGYRPDINMRIINVKS